MDYRYVPWRVGRSVGRTIYAVLAGDVGAESVLIGLMDTRELAETAVETHNACLGVMESAHPTADDLG